MAVDVELVRLLLESKHLGVSFRKCLTLGRQHYFASQGETRLLFQRHGIDPAEHPDLFSGEGREFADQFWTALGSAELQTIDASDYEGASIIHDLSLPIPKSLQETPRYVRSVGTLEHVFNFPVAIRNCMEMVRPGGHLLLYTPANNFLGHGLYQFSPELFFRVLSPANGFKIERMIAVEYSPWRRRYEALDPAVHRRRWAHVNKYRLLLFVQASRERVVPILETPPQQSDYAALWTESQSKAVESSTPAHRESSWKRVLLEQAPRLARWLEAIRYSSWSPRCSLRDAASFRRTD